MQHRAFVRRRFSLLVLFGALLFLTLATSSPASPVTVDGDLEVLGVASPITFDWQVVVNNDGEAFPVPGDMRSFNSYNQPSLNVDRLVVFRARTKGGMGSGYGPPVHGIFTRDMSGAGAPVRIFDRRTLVPEPNNTPYPPTGPLAMFIEPPSFPRIDMWSDTIATRGNHQPVWNYLLDDGTETRAGTTGIYTNPFGSLIAGASNLGAVPGFGFFAVPDTDPAIKFDVFPGAPAVADGSTIVFKGNYTTSEDLGMTGVYYRDLANAPIELPNGTYLEPGGGMGPVVLIADTNTLIPGTDTTFGSTAPPSAVGRQAVFAGFDNEASPTEGGIYLAPLKPIDKKPRLTPLVEIGDQVPGEKRNVTFNRLGEGVSFDGRFVAFWGAWGTETKTLVLHCPTEGNKDRIAFCNEEDDYKNGFAVAVPVNQGIFVHDTVLDLTSSVAKTPTDYADLVYWNFSGRVPGMGEGGGDDDTGEPARWRSATFLAVSGLADGTPDDATFHAAFKARTGEVDDLGAYVDPVDGIYMRKGPGKSPTAIMVETGMDGTLLDPAAVDSATGDAFPVTEMGIERDGFRGDALVINLRMGAEETGWAGIYLTTVPEGLK